MMKTQYTLVILLLSLLSKFSYSAQLALAELATLPNKAGEQLLDIIPVERQAGFYMAATQTSQIYLLNSNSNKPALTTIFHGPSINPKYSKLRALVLHPNFAVRDQTGYHTIYTAHQQVVDHNHTGIRLKDNQLTRSQLQHDIVINEWQLSHDLNVDITSKREVIRIGLPSTQSINVQLSFNPYNKIWHEHFGLLYIGLSQLDGYQQSPLYSGTILRINPHQYGLNSYTVPPGNPFLTQHNIHDEILFFKLAQVNQFVWSDKSADSLWLDHSVKQQRQISQLSNRTKLTTAPRTLFAFEQTSAHGNQLVRYYGQQLGYLYGAAILMAKYHEQPQLNVLRVANRSGANNYQLSPLFPIDAKYPAQLFNDAQGELLVYQRETGKLSKLITVSLADSETGNTSSFSNHQIEQYAVISILFILTAWPCWQVFTRFKHHQQSATAFYQQQYHYLELIKEHREIALFHHHQSAPAKRLAINTIKAIQLCINGQLVVELSPEQGMTNNLALLMRDAGNNEKREKMSAEKLRYIQLVLIDKKGQQAAVSFYLRKGDNRISKANFQVALAEVIDWAWLLSSVIAPATTEQRQPLENIQVVNKSRPVKHHIKTLSPVPPTYQIDQPQPLTSTEPQLSADITPPKLITTANQNLANQSKYNEAGGDINGKKATKHKVVKEQSDTQIIAALEKLVSLKKQKLSYRG